MRAFGMAILRLRDYSRAARELNVNRVRSCPSNENSGSVSQGASIGVRVHARRASFEVRDCCASSSVVCVNYMCAKRGGCFEEDGAGVQTSRRRAAAAILTWF